MSSCAPDATAPSAAMLSIHISPEGNDAWSGALATPNADRTDGPLATITAARDRLRARRAAAPKGAPATVWLRGGRYPLSQPVAFGPQDSHTTFAAFPGEYPVVDAGRRITEWREDRLHGLRVWVADLSEASEGGWCFKQVFVNGRRCPRPRLPRSGFFTMRDVPGTSLTSPLFHGSNVFDAAPGDIRPWRNLADVEVVALHWWIEERMPIAAFDERTHRVTSSRRSVFALRDDQGKGFARYYVENIFEALTEPGEWYLDHREGRLYYLPLPGETPETAEVYAPVAERFLDIAGCPEEGRCVEELHFRGIAFEHADWTRPTGGAQGFADEELDPATDYAGSPQAAFNVGAAIRFEGARSCSVTACRMAHVGGYALELGEGCGHIRVVGNELCDLGAGGIRMNGAGAQGPACRRTGENILSDNHIHHAGCVFHSAVGILSAHAFGNEIAHNHIHDLFYTGISCGWTWGYAESVCRDNRIEKNHIHDLGFGLLSDLGGIYVLGVQPGTVIRHNHIHHLTAYNYGAWPIYLDQGASHILVEGNVCHDTNAQIFCQHFGRENIVRNNLFAFGDDGIVALGRGEAHRAFTLERNILITDAQPFYIGGHAHDLASPRFAADLNLLWNVSGAASCAGRNGVRGETGRAVARREFTLGQLRDLGYDAHSIVSDPRFRDLAGRDFTLLPDSPAFALGFVPPDLSDVGPRRAETLDALRRDARRT